MKFQERRLHAAQHFHGIIISATKQMRAQALLINFCPYSPSIIEKHVGKQSPFEKLNGYRYRDNWLENLLVASSLNGYQM